MPKRRDESGQEVSFGLVDDSADKTPTLPVYTDDNDEPSADASGDSEDETPEENEAAATWQKGEE